MSLLRLRFAKLFTALARPKCWRALRHGVAPAIEHAGLLRTLAVDGIIDVGANRGQFTLACRLVLPGVPVVAFEPIPTEAAVFEEIHGGDPGVRLFRNALGDRAGTAVIHLSQALDSSSLLPIGARQAELFKGTGEIGTMEVPVARLDDFAGAWTGRSRQLLKIDVQGFELQVLRGARATLATCACIYAECSELPLYDGQALREEVQQFLRSRGFEAAGRFNEIRRGGALVQADMVFLRSEGGSQP